MFFLRDGVFLPRRYHELDFINQTNIKSENQWILRNLVFCVCSYPIYSGRQVCGRIPAGVTQEEGHTGFLHLPSAVLALIFLARRIQPSLSLVDREVAFCVLTIKSFSTCWAFFFFFCEGKSQLV